MGGFLVDGWKINWRPPLTTWEKGVLDVFLATCRQSVEAPNVWMRNGWTVVPGFFERNLPIGIQTGNVIDALRNAVLQILEPHELTMG